MFPVRTSPPRLLARWLAAGLILVVTAAVPVAAYAAATHAQIEGSGSSWSGRAVDTWISDGQHQGLPVTYTAPGSAQGRKDFGFKTMDYAVTDIPFQGRDPVSGEIDSNNGRPYAYVPIVAGGTSFPYQIKVAGQKIRNLRLSGATLAKIFTNQITNWNDPAVTSDNNGRKLPSLPIIPVVHSEGSGSSAQFTAYLAKQYPVDWTPFNGGRAAMNEYFPRKGHAIAQNGSDGVMNFLASAAANGAIGYDEYSYALNAGFPVAKIQNAAGYFTLPTDTAVAKSMTQAEINRDPTSPEYLIQKLDKVYTYTDDRTYPLSSYSYLILPTGTDKQDAKLSTAKRQTMVDFLFYSLCAGQAEMGPLGYSPLPVNLVKAGFEQVQKLKVADDAVAVEKRDVSTCHNPTFKPDDPDGNYLADTAPHPQPCDKAGQGPCADGSAKPTVDASSTTSNGSGAGGGAGATAAPSQSAGPEIDPATGQEIRAVGISGDATNTATDLAAARSAGMTAVLAPLSVLELLGVLILPVLLHQRFARRRRDEP